MKFHLLIKKTLLLSILIMLTACSSQKDATSQDDSDGMIGSGQISTAQSMGQSIPGMSAGSIEQMQQENAVYFGLDKYDILPNYTDILDLHANFLRSNPTYKVTIEGHADERGTPEYNIALGERRANAVKMYLQGKGVLENQTKIVSYGKERPAVEGHDELTYAKNRRAILIYAY